MASGIARIVILTCVSPCHPDSMDTACDEGGSSKQGYQAGTGWWIPPACHLLHKSCVSYCRKPPYMFPIHRCLNLDEEIIEMERYSVCFGYQYFPIHNTFVDYSANQVNVSFTAHFCHLFIQLLKMCLQFRPGHSFQCRLWSINFETLSINFVLCHPFSSIAIKIRGSL